MLFRSFCSYVYMIFIGDFKMLIGELLEQNCGFPEIEGARLIGLGFYVLRAWTLMWLKLYVV